MAREFLPRHNLQPPTHRFRGSEIYLKIRPKIRKSFLRSLKTENQIPSGPQHIPETRNPEQNPEQKIPLFFNAIPIFSYFS